MPTNVTNSAETNVITTEQMVRAREIDFINRFNENILAKLNEAMGVTRKIPMTEGTTMYVYKTTGTLQSGQVPEGEIIPLSQYARTKTPVGEMALDKWRKATTAEAIQKSGYDEAVKETDSKMLKDIQKSIRSDLFNFIDGIDGATVVGGSTLQAVIAKTWGELQVLFEDDAVETVHFINPRTIADYRRRRRHHDADSPCPFLGMGTVIMNSLIPQGEVISTAKENIIMYYMTMSGDVAKTFSLTTDETGFVGMHIDPNFKRAQQESIFMSGIKYLVEYANGVVRGLIDSTPTLQSVTVTSDQTGASSGQSHISTSAYSLGAGEKFVYKTGTTAPTVTYGQKLGSTWTDLPANGIITPTATHTKITVAAIDANGKAQAAGNQTLSIKA